MLTDLNKADRIPFAEIYFIGFPVFNQSCSLQVMECLNVIKSAKLAIFGTCGLYPTEKYLNQIEKGVISIVILIYLGIWHTESIANIISWLAGLFMPFLIGVILALMLNVPMSFIERHLLQKIIKGRRALASLLHFSV